VKEKGLNRPRGTFLSRDKTARPPSSITVGKKQADGCEQKSGRSKRARGDIAADERGGVLTASERKRDPQGTSESMTIFRDRSTMGLATGRDVQEAPITTAGED